MDVCESCLLVGKFSGTLQLRITECYIAVVRYMNILLDLTNQRCIPKQKQHATMSLWNQQTIRLSKALKNVTVSRLLCTAMDVISYTYEPYVSNVVLLYSGTKYTKTL